MARVYIASRLRNRSRCREYRDALIDAGHTCTSTWLDEPSFATSHADIAKRDLADLRRADTLILVGHAGRNAANMCEFGMAYERGMRMLHVAADRGDQVFTHLPDVAYHRTFNDALSSLPQRRKTAA